MKATSPELQPASFLLQVCRFGDVNDAAPSERAATGKRQDAAQQRSTFTYGVRAGGGPLQLGGQRIGGTARAEVGVGQQRQPDQGVTLGQAVGATLPWRGCQACHQVAQISGIIGVQQPCQAVQAGAVYMERSCCAPGGWRRLCGARVALRVTAGGEETGRRGDHQ